MTLGVAFAAAILCDISQGLAYTWSLRSSAGLGVALPPAVSTHRQTLTIPGYFLEPGHYTALAKVGRGPTAPLARAASHCPPLASAQGLELRTLTHVCVFLSP